MRALRHIGRLNDPSAFRSWLNRIAERACYDLIRRNVDHAPLPDMVDERVPLPEEHAIASDDACRLHEQVALLGVRSGRALWLRDGLGFPVADIARDLQMTEGSVRVLLCRARSRLRVLCQAALGLLPAGLWDRTTSRVHSASRWGEAVHPVALHLATFGPAVLATAVALLVTPLPAVDATAAGATPIADSRPGEVEQIAPMPRPVPAVVAKAPVVAAVSPAPKYAVAEEAVPAAAPGRGATGRSVGAVHFGSAPPDAPPTAELGGATTGVPLPEVEVFAGEVGEALVDTLEELPVP